MREDWVEIELEKVCEYSKGKKPKMLVKEYSKNSPFPYINIKAFEKGIFEEYTDGEKCNLCEEGDLLMVWDGARAGLTGKAKKGAIGSTLMKIEPKGSIEKNYLFYFLLSLYKKLNTNPRGVGIPHVEPRLLWDSRFIIPAKPTQRAIVQKIETLFASLDKGIADLKKAQEQLKVYRQAVLKKAFEGELTKEWREKHVKTDGRPSQEKATTAIAAEPTTEYEQQGADKLMEGWKIVKLGDVLKQSKEKHKPDNIENIFYIGLEHIEKETGNLTPNVGAAEIKNIKNKFHKGQILYGKLRPYLNKVYLAKEDGVCSTDILVFDIDKFLNPYFALNFILSRKFVNDMSENTNGVNLPRVSTKYVNNYAFPLPPKEEQHQIVREIESRLSVCDKVEQNITEGLEKSEALRQSILKKAFEGRLLSEAEIEQCKQEADYEPASVLLEKIKSEQD